MRVLYHCMTEALSSIHRDRRRLLPMALGIVWGMASVMVLLAIAGGFEKSQVAALGAYGDRFLLLRLNRAELDRAAGGRERRLMMDPFDVDRLRRGAPAIRHLSPLNNAYRARITARHGAGSRVIVSGVLPEITRLRNMPLEAGRFFNEIEEAGRRRVIVLGPQARRQLFGQGPAVGQKVRVAGFSTSDVPPPAAARALTDATRRGAAAGVAALSPVVASTRTARVGSGATPGRRAPGSTSSSPASRDLQVSGELFEVIGVLADTEVQRESYVSLSRHAFVPFSTSSVVFERDFNLIYIEPRTIEDRDLALWQFRQVMGARYGFGPGDENAVLVYFDGIERARKIAAIFGALRLFLSLVGISILAIGAIGVMNVVLVSVAARRFEIGLRKALGATPLAIYLQFFLETVLGCIVSGLAGFILGAAGIAVLSVLPLPEGFSRPELDVRTALLACGLLTAVAVIVGIYPARRAAALPPVEALRARG